MFMFWLAAPSCSFYKYWVPLMENTDGKNYKKVFDKKFRKMIFLLSSLLHSAKRLAFNKTVAFYFIFLFLQKFIAKI